MNKNIKLTQGLITIIDDSDSAIVQQHSWHASFKNGTPYAQSSIKDESGKYKNVLLHRKLMNAGSDQIVDHINGNTLDNRRSNLRFATSAENARNKRSSSKYGHSGVRKVNGSWNALISPNGIDIALGTYPTIELAAAAYNEAAKAIFGEFAKLNSVEPNPTLLENIVQMKQAAIARLEREIEIIRGAA